MCSRSTCLNSMVVAIEKLFVSQDSSVHVILALAVFLKSLLFLT